MSVLESTTWGKRAIHLSNLITKADTSVPTAIILRHSAREEPKNLEEIFVAPLTEDGVKGAEEFGNLLPANLTYHIYSSPVGRCVATATAISKGIQENHNNFHYHGTLEELTKIEGDTSKVVESIKEHSFEFVNYWIAGFFDKDLIEPAQTTAKKIAKIVKKNTENQKAGEVYLYVSHDFHTLISLFYWSGILATGEWISYNDGFIIQFYPKKFKVYFHDRVKEGKYPAWWIE